MEHDEHVMQLRGQIVRAVVHQVDDSTSEQQLVVESHASVVRDQVTVHQPFGFASRAPADGAVTVLFATGGDQTEVVALPPSNPQAARFGDLGEGESVLYDEAGQRVHLVGGKIVQVYATQELQVYVAGTLVFDLTAQRATLNVDLQVNGKVAATGDVVGNGISLDTHVHGGVQAGNSETSKPQ